MNKVLIVLTSALVLIISPLKVSAVSVLGISDSDASNTEKVTIYAEPPSSSKAVQLRLDVEGGEIISFQSPTDDNLLSIGTCDNGSSYTKDSVCMDVAATDGEVQRGEVLGIMTIKKDSAASTINISKSTENAYYTETGNLLSDNGIAQQFFSGNNILAKTPEPQSNAFVYLTLIGILAMGAVVGAGLGVGFTVAANEVYKLHLPEQTSEE